MRIVRVKPIHAYNDRQIFEQVSKSLAQEKGLKLHHLLDLTDRSSLKAVEERLEDGEIKFPGSLLVVTRVLTSSTKGRLSLFAVKATKINPENKHS